MKCQNPECDNEILIHAASNIKTKNCHVLTNQTSILTIQCDKCKHIFQTSIQSKTFLSINKEK